jgi:hypothetical protein
MNIFTSKIKEIIFTVLPITIIVVILNFTVAPLETDALYRFFIGTILVILGLTLFLVGVDVGVMPFGKLIGSTLAKKNKLWLIIVGGLLLGFFISIAEPGLLVFANQVERATSGQISTFSLLIIVSAGFAVMIALGCLRIIFNLSIKLILFISYIIIFIFALFSHQIFVAIAFDASGATTGELAVPFILAIAAGIASLKKDSISSEESSFGLVAFASAGAVLSVIVINVFTKTQLIDLGLNIEPSSGVLAPFINELPFVVKESLIAIAPITVIYFIMQMIFFKLNKKRFFRILKGFVITLIGLIIFLLGVNAGFMEVGIEIGQILVNNENKIYILLTGFAIGFFTVMAEPAVYVLTHQIEDITSGYIKRKAVLIFLAIGVGIALLLSVIRIITPGIELWHYLLPGYIIAFILSIFTPNLFVGIAFDGGGVATGPLTATFTLAFVQGAANAFETASVLTEGFGMIAMVALFPIITLQILGLIFVKRSRKVGIR